MINLTIKNNYIQFGGGVEQSDVRSGSVYMNMSSFCSASMCLLIGAFNPFTFKVIIDMYDPITIFLIVLGLFSVGRTFPSLVFCLEKFL